MLNQLTLKQNALILAIERFAVFPLQERGKQPLAKTNGLKDATRKLDTVRPHWETNPNYNIGIATGKVSDLVVIDLDGDEAVRWFREQNFPNTRCVVTGKGYHLYYGMPLGADWRIRNSASRLAPNVDVRGDGGYVVAPPSVHPDGRVYQWLSVDTDIVPLPEPLAELCHKDEIPLPPSDFEPRTEPNTSPYGRAALDRACDHVRASTQGSRNDTLNACAFSVGRFVAGGEIDRVDAETALVAAGVESGLSGGYREALSVVRRAMNAANRYPKRAPN